MNPQALGALIARDQESVEKEMALLEEALAVSAQDMRNVAPILEDIRWIAVASLIEKVYMGWERIMKRIAIDVDGYCPQGDSWHRDLVEQMGMPVGRRPAVFAPATVAEIHALRSFRHRERNLYGVEVEKGRARDIAVRARLAWGFWKADLKHFLDLLGGSTPPGV